MKKAYKVMNDKKAIAAFETLENAKQYISNSSDNLEIKETNLCKSVISLIIKTDYTYLYRPMPETWKEFFPVITVNELKEFGFSATTKHNGKMTGMFSFSTTCKCNDLCLDKIKAAYKSLGIEITDKKTAKESLKAYLKENPFSTNISICAFCFSDSQQDIFPSMIETLSRNYEILNNGIIHSDYLPVLNNLYFRGESFGDFASVNAVINFYNIAAKNKLVRVTVWSKNLIFFRQARKQGYIKPSNLTLIYSSMFINKPAFIPKDCKELVDKRFTVYTKEYAEKHNIKINCGARACLACLNCYMENNIFDICELVK